MRSSRGEKPRAGVTWAWVGLVLLGLSFIVVAQRLFADRYATGDIYPAYSSWGSDADGTRALFRALRELETPDVERSVRPLYRMAEDFEDEEASSTAVLLAGWAGRLGRATGPALDAMARAGGRVIVAVAPAGWSGEDEAEGVEARDTEREETAIEDAETRQAETEQAEIEQPETEESQSEDAGGEGEDAEEGADDDRGWTPVNPFGRWGAVLTAGETEGPWSAGRSGEAYDALPVELPWPSRFYFELANDDWTVLYATANGPVLIERALGDGALVLATANHFLTNVTQARDRQSALVVRLLGEAERVIFEESHLGIVASPGVVALARRYRLHGVGLALIAVMLLAVWRGASSLMPAMERLAPSGVEARSSREGMVALLRRGIAERELLAVCLEQWSASEYHEAPDEEARAIARTPDPVKGYRRLSRLLQRTRRSG